MQFSLTHVLLTVEIGFLFFLAWRFCGLDRSNRRFIAVNAHLSLVTGYAIITSILGATGLYISDSVLALLPGLWLQLITVAVCVLPVVFFRSLREGIREVIDCTPWHWFAGYHAMRIAALGTAYKTHIGEFPAYFEYLVGVPDLLFGLSAFWVARLAARNELSARSFLIWNLVGALIIVPSAPILLQLGLPGPLQVFTGVPDARAVFTYPMSIAPMIGVPLFVLVNLAVAWRLWETGAAEDTGRSGGGAAKAY